MKKVLVVGVFLNAALLFAQAEDPVEFPQRELP